MNHKFIFLLIALLSTKASAYDKNNLPPGYKLVEGMPGQEFILSPGTKIVSSKVEFVPYLKKNNIKVSSKSKSTTESITVSYASGVHSTPWNINPITVAASYGCFYQNDVSDKTLDYLLQVMLCTTVPYNIDPDGSMGGCIKQSTHFDVIPGGSMSCGDAFIFLTETPERPGQYTTEGIINLSAQGEFSQAQSENLIDVW